LIQTDAERLTAGGRSSPILGVSVCCVL